MRVRPEDGVLIKIPVEVFQLSKSGLVLLDRVGIEFHWYSPTPFCIFNPIAHGLGNKGCAACDGLIHVSPSGEVLPCSSFARGVGNIQEDGLENVWFGNDAQYYKKKRMAHPICRTCEHFKLCQGACTLYWSSMGYGELYRANFRRLAGKMADTSCNSISHPGWDTGHDWALPAP